MTRKYFSSEKGTLEASATPFTPGLGYSPDIHVSLLNSTTAIKINPTSLTLMVTSLALISVLKQFS